VADQKRQKLQSYETICDSLPHIVWTTAVDGQAGYFSQRVKLTTQILEIVLMELKVV
jgi:hypothetical protein